MLLDSYKKPQSCISSVKTTYRPLLGQNGKKRVRSSSFDVSYCQSQNESSDFLFLRKPCWRLWTNPWGVVCSLYCGVLNQVNCIVTVGYPAPAATSPLPPSGRRSLIVFYPSHDTQRRQDGSCGTLLCPIHRQNWFFRARLVTQISRTSTSSEKHAGTLAGREKPRGAVDNNTGCEEVDDVIKCSPSSWAEHSSNLTLSCCSFSCCMEFPSGWNQAGCDQNIE